MTDTTLERRTLAWMNDPYDAVGYSNTQMHSVPREEAEALQLAGINMRLEQRRAEIPVLAKLADAQQISRVSRLEEAAPLFFTHDIYKSYPLSLLAKSRKAASSCCATGFARAARSCRNSITSRGEPAILVASDSSAAFAKPSSCAASWRSAMIFSMRSLLSNLPAFGPWEKNVELTSTSGHSFRITRY